MSGPLVLWCVHVIGPDNVFAMASEEAAQLAATELNAAFAETVRVTNIDCRAVAEPWPYSADSHAADLAEGEARFW